MPVDFVPVHAYGGLEHEAAVSNPNPPGAFPIEGCLLCRLEAAESHGDEMRQLAHRLEEENADLRDHLRRAWGCLAGLAEEAGMLVNSATGSGEDGFSRVPNERIYHVIGTLEAVRDLEAFRDKRSAE